MTAPTKPTIDLTTTVKEINRLHQAIIEADQTIADTSKTILQHRIDIGVMLINVKATDYGKHGKWEDWLTLNCPAIPLSTARLYMKLAQPANQKTLEEKAAQIDNTVSDLSIRAARRLLTKSKPEGQGNPTGKKRGRKAAAEAAVEPVTPAASPDLNNLLAAVDVDELVTALNAEWEWTQICYLHQLLSEKIDEHNEQGTRVQRTEELLPDITMN
jgi:hypothetical protein